MKVVENPALDMLESIQSILEKESNVGIKPNQTPTLTG